MQYDEYGNIIPETPYDLSMAQEEAYRRTRPPKTGLSIPEAASAAQDISAKGRVPYLTNTMPSDPNIESQDILNIAPSEMRIPKKPTNQDMALANEIVNFRKFIVDNVYGGVDYGQSNSANDSQKAEFNNTMKLYTDLFAKDLVERRRAETKDNEFNIRYGNNPYDPKESSFTEWDDNTKNTAVHTKLLTGKEPKFASRDSKGKAAFEKYTNEYMNANGLSAADVANIQTSYKALDGSIKKQQTQLNAAGNFARNLIKQVDYAETLFQGLSRTDARLLNVPLRELKTKLAGSGLESAYQMFIKEISAEALKLSMGSQASIAQIPEGNRQEWERVHDINLPLSEMRKVLQATKQAATIRIQSIEDEKNETGNQIKALQDLVSPKEKRTGTAQPTAQNPGNRDVSVLGNYIASNATKFSQKDLYNKMKAAGWTDEEIKTTWRAYRGR